MKTKGKPQAAKPSPLPAYEVVGFKATVHDEQGLDHPATMLWNRNSCLIIGAILDKKNAAMIAQAVNAHAGLVEALCRAEAGAVMNLEELDALTAASGTEDYQEIRSYLVSVRDEARAALRAAGEAV